MLIYLEMIPVERDKEKFEQIYLKYRGLMYNLAVKITEHQEDAEDAVHQAFLYILEYLNKVDKVSSDRTRSFISIIVEHKAIDIVRKRRPTIPEDAVYRKAVGYLPEDDGTGSAIAKLPKQEQDLLILRYYHGYSARELAKMLGISHAAVRKRISRAKTDLREILDKEMANQ